MGRGERKGVCAARGRKRLFVMGFFQRYRGITPPFGLLKMFREFWSGPLTCLVLEDYHVLKPEQGLVSRQARSLLICLSIGYSSWLIKRNMNRKYNFITEGCIVPTMEMSSSGYCFDTCQQHRFELMWLFLTPTQKWHLHFNQTKYV